MTKDSEPDSWIGRTLKDRYHIVEVLSEGGFGKIYRAEDLEIFNSPRVVKRLRFHGSYPDDSKPLRERFELEARTLMELGKDEQIPVLYAYEPDDYLVQEFVVGKTLEKTVSNGGRLPEERVRPILISLLKVLDLVHSKRKIHRDVKPANIILRERDHLPVLIDFGAVKELTTANLQFPTMPLGTMGYSVPEQLYGNPDYFFDLYSLGATALYMLTGKEPQLLNAPRRGDGGWLKYASNVSESLASIINKAMLSGPDRYCTALEMREDLLSSMDGDRTKPLERRDPLFDMATGHPVVARKHPADFPLPPEHLYLREGKQTGEHILYRKKDGQVVLYLPKDSKAATFVIDQHLVTNQQFALFINDPKVAPHVRLTKLYDVPVATSTDGSLLVADAQSFWGRNGSQPLEKSAGLIHTHEGWTPLAGSEHLPVVLVSVLGGSWYAAWLKDLPVEEARIGFGLPSESQWIRASLLDQNTGVQRRFPWGNSWDRQRLNSLSYWASRDLREVEINVRSEATLTPVGQFPEGASASGLMDAFGNAWEWLKESDGSGGYMIRGGAFTSPTSVFDTAVMYRQNDFVSQAIGFRCAWQA